MQARYPYLFALALALPLSSCRIVGGKPDFSVFGEAFTPAVTDRAYVETRPTPDLPLATASPVPAPAALPPPPAHPDPAPANPPAATPPTDKPGFFTQAYWRDLFSVDSIPDIFSSSCQAVPRHEAKRQAPPPTKRPAAAAPAANGSYTVCPGDTLSRIARMHNVPLANLAIVNGIDLQAPVIRPGQHLHIPPAAAPGNAPRAPRPQSAAAPQPAPPAPAQAATSAPRPAATASQSPRRAATTYRVKAGDTLFRIAHRHGITLKALLRANQLNEEGARNVRVGSTLTIPTP